MRETETPRPAGRAWRSTVALSLAIVAVVAYILSLVPSPYLIMRPGPTVDVLGEAHVGDEPEPVIASPESETYESDGSLRLVAVSIQGSPEHPVSWLKMIPALFDPSQVAVPVSELYPDDSTVEDREAENEVLMDDSQSQAAAAAFAALGYDVPVTMTVTGTIEDGPAVGVLRAGDVILEIGGEPAADFAELRQRVIDSGADREISVTVERDGERVTESITPRMPVDGEYPMIGALVSSAYELPHEVDFSLSDISGPSAGLVFALGLYELLTPGSFLEGQDVGVTGTIDSNGDVGPIGGLGPKIWSAQRAGSELFLMPFENCADLPARLPSGIRIAPVETLDEAIGVIEGQQPIRSCR